MLQQTFTVVGPDRPDMNRPAVAQHFLGTIAGRVDNYFVTHNRLIQSIAIIT
jgi:hypothetical protein